MTHEVRILSPQHSIQSAAQAMSETDVGMLPVAEGDRLVGIVTDRDIAIRGVGRRCTPDTPVEEVMTKEVKYCFDDEDADEVLDNMADLQIRRLPVLSRGKRLVGIVSLSDLADEEARHTGKALSDIARPTALHSQHC
jgi:CBS domain-containing protein